MSVVEFIADKLGALGGEGGPAQRVYHHFYWLQRALLTQISLPYTTYMYTRGEMPLLLLQSKNVLLLRAVALVEMLKPLETSSE